MTLRPRARRTGTARWDSMCGRARNTTSASAASRSASTSWKASDDRPRRWGNTLARGWPARRSDVTATSSTFGWTQSRRSSSAPMYPLAPATATLSTPDLPLGVLELGPGARLAVLLPLLHPRVAGEQPGTLERLAQLVVEL